MSSSKYEKSSRSDRDYDRDRRRRRRHRSPSYDSYSSSESYDSDDSRASSPPRRSSRKSRAAYSDSEDRDYRRGRDRERRRRDEYYYEKEEESPTRRNVVEDLMAAVGLVKAKNKHRDGKSDRDGRRDRGDRDGLSREDKKKAQKQALQAALTAAAMEAFKTRKEGGLTPQRLLQIAGAAIAAGGVDALIDRNPNSHSMRHIIESVVAGLAAGKTVGGQVEYKRGNMKDRAGGGLIGMATKQILSRSMSRGANKKRS